MVAIAQVANTVTIPLYYQPLIDQQILSNISWGTPAQEPIPTVIDTGSFGFWAFGPNATVNSGSPYLGVLGPCNQTAEPFLDWPASTTHVGPTPGGTTYSYGGGGKIVPCMSVVNDTMNFPGFAAVNNTQVALCDFMLIKERATTCAGAHYDKSILGLAPIAGNGPRFRDNLAAQGVVDSHVYSVWFESLPEDINEPQAGTLLLGGVPEDKDVGDLATMNLVADANGVDGLYYVSMPEVLVAPFNGSNSPQVIPVTVPSSGTVPNCLVDTGTWGLTLPTNDTAFYAATGLEEDSPYILPRWPSACADIPINATLDLRFTGADGKSATIKIPLRNLAQGPGQIPDTCSLNLQLGDPGCTFGGPFFTAALSVFDDEAKTVAFAPLAATSEKLRRRVASREA
jgi:hypothetical protein